MTNSEECMKQFDAFLNQKGIKLSLPQKRVCDVVLTEATNNKLVGQLLFFRQTGKTFLFELLDEFFSSIEISNPSDFMLANEHWHAAIDPTIKSTD